MPEKKKPNKKTRPPRQSRPRPALDRTNPIYTDDELSALPRLPLNGGSVGKEVAVSPEDHAFLSRYKWYESSPHRGTQYFFAYDYDQPKDDSGRPPTVILHRLVAERMGLTGGRYGYSDYNHYNSSRGNIINVNRREALMRGKAKKGKLYSAYKGVTRTKSGAFSAHLYENSQPLFLGTYPTDHLAAAAYNGAVLARVGPKARLNAIKDPAAPCGLHLPGELADTLSSILQAARAGAVGVDGQRVQSLIEALYVNEDLPEALK